VPFGFPHFVPALYFPRSGMSWRCIAMCGPFNKRVSSSFVQIGDFSGIRWPNSTAQSIENTQSCWHLRSRVFSDGVSAFGDGSGYLRGLQVHIVC
jgi:hypothetical protein